MIDLEKNKSNAQAFYDLMFNQCEPRKAVEQFVGDEYVQHNPHVADGKEAFIEYFERMAAEYQGKVKIAKIDTDSCRDTAVKFGISAIPTIIIIKDGEIVYERYGLGNSEDTLWISFSVAKSVVSMLMGAAVQDGYIKSLDEKVTDYLPRLKNSSYD